MPKCPRCGAEIDYLRDFSPVWEEFKFTVDEDGLELFGSMDNLVPMDKEDEYECPKCNEVLFRDCEKATAFLRGEKMKVELNSDGSIKLSQEEEKELEQDCRDMRGDLANHIG